MDDIDRALAIMEHGGEVSDGMLPRVPRQAEAALARERELWDELRRLLLVLLTPTGDTADEDARNAAYRRASALIPELLASAVEVVNGLDVWRDELRRRVLYIGIASTFVAVLALIGSLVFAWREFVTPVVHLRRQALRMPEVDLPESSGNELQAVSNLVSKMSTDVERLRSEREEVEEELRQVEADYQAIFENAAAGIYEFDLEGRLLLANAATAQLLGYGSSSELLRVVANVHEELFADPEHQRALMAAAKGAGPLDSETKLRRKDGSLIWVRESGRFNAVPDGTGYFESVIIDVTPRKNAEESLRELSILLLRSQEEERRRIARELHDSTGQMLAALEINLDRLNETLQEIPAEMRDALTSCRDLVVECSREVRSMSYLLHPPMLEELGLLYALREFAEGFSHRSGIKSELHLPVDLDRIPSDVELALFRVAQEALTNIHRHAESPIAIITLRAEPDEIQLSVADQGKGIPGHLVRSGEVVLSHMGVGIRGMVERMKQLGGWLRVDSGPDGTRVEAALPLRKAVGG
jgi:PAS domain S-box-containing protein